MPISSGKKLLLYLVMMFFTLSAVVVGGEVTVRLFLPFQSIPENVKKRSFQYLRSMFSRHRLKPLQLIDGRSPGSQYHINAHGFRGHSFAPRKPNGIKRVIVIGGSSVFDMYANEGEDWPHLAGLLLEKIGIKNVEVINAGIPGHASFDSLGRLYSELWIYEPDYVLYYGAWNDIKYFRTLTPEKPLISLFRPYVPRSQFNPFIEYRGPWDRFLARSQLYLTLRNRYYHWRITFGPEGRLPEGSAAEYQDRYSPYAVKQYRLNVQMIVDACKDIGAIPILVTEPTLVSANNSTEERKKIVYPYVRLTHQALVKAFSETYEIIRTEGQKKEAAVLDLANELNGKDELFVDHIHLSTKGSKEVAKRVADFLAAHLTAKSSSTEKRGSLAGSRTVRWVLGARRATAANAKFA